uniref:Ribonuclease A-domain domain-containing protein n=1 Tax=Neolamprologus brichardi TaxID=32507 RepID=A0A3Q4MMY4_NEOBR
MSADVVKKNKKHIFYHLSTSTCAWVKITQESDDERVDNFKNQHIIETEESCDKLIRKRKIKDVNGKDKERNTFIFSTFDKVKAICTEKQRVYKNDNLYRSSEEMELLYCKLQHDKKNYKGEMIKKHIEIACVKIDGVLQPVHFECCC